MNVPKQIEAVLRLTEIAEDRGIERAALLLEQEFQPELAALVRGLKHDAPAVKQLRKEAA